MESEGCVDRVIGTWVGEETVTHLSKCNVQSGMVGCCGNTEGSNARSTSSLSVKCNVHKCRVKAGTRRWYYESRPDNFHFLPGMSDTYKPTS